MSEALEPITRKEKFYSRIAGDDTEVLEPITRKEKFYSRIAGDDTETPEPITREEMWLNKIIESGGGGGGDIEVESLSVTENGTYTAETGKAYSPVTVDVQGGDEVFNAILDGTFTGRFETSATFLRDSVLQSLNGMTSIYSTELEKTGSWSVSRCSNLETAVLTKCKELGGATFRECPKFKALDIYGATNKYLNNQCCMSDTLFDTFIIRNSIGVSPLNNANFFQSTPFASDGTGGTLYVPQALISSYQSATNWSTILGYANNQIKAIEGSIYETQYADGTPIS